MRRMSPKQRMLTTMRHGVPDRLPVAPDVSNMIPARLTGKPFWDIYLYEDPPLWKAYIDAVKHFGFDGFLDYQVQVIFPDEEEGDLVKYFGHTWNKAVVERTDERIVVRLHRRENGKIVWDPGAIVYPRDNPPTYDVPVEKLGLPKTPESWEPVEGVKPWPKGEDLFGLAYEMMGDRGVVGMVCGNTVTVYGVEGVYEYYDDPEVARARCRRNLENARGRFANIMKMKVKPDYIGCGGSGTLVFQTVDIFRDVSLPILKEVTRLCKEAGIVSYVHSCGPEKELVKICAEETDLDVIDPLETPPMGDCNLADLKRRFGNRMVLKGNLHTTQVMLKGTAQEVLEASRQAISDAGAGGGFILSTGDQCGRDTPDENIRAMIDAVERWGRY
ncbi:MAG: uroporphyrinogen decarboxylase family protein [Planctomycetota bacterium]